MTAPPPPTDPPGDDTPAGGLVVTCTRGGEVLEVVHDGAATGLRPGQLLAEALADGHVEELLWLLRQASVGRAGAAGRLPFVSGGTVRPLDVVARRSHEAGAAPDTFVLAATDGDAAVERLVDAVATERPALVAGLRPTPEPVGGDGAGTAESDLLLAMSQTNNELMNMHRELAQQRARLAQVNRRQEEILAMVAHDLRNPLATIVGFSEALQRQLADSIDASAMLLLERIESQGRRMVLLVEDLVDASVIERGMREPDIAEVDVHALIRESAALAATAANRKGLTIEVEAPDGELTAMLDPDRIAQVLDNLLSNAIKFTPRSTAGTGEDGVSAGTVSVSYGTDADQLWIVVADDGIGIDPHLRPTLFQPFARAAPTAPDGEPSTGLGLAISRSLVEAHGGSIEVDQTTGRSTTFVVRLPLAPQGS